MKNNNIPNSEYFRDTRFNGLAIPGSVITDKEFYKCSFDNCDMSNARFETCRFEDCDFNNCDISLVKFKMSEFIDVRFYETKLLGINWTEIKNQLKVKFRKCKLNHSTFFGLNLASIIIKECLANEVDFTDANLNKANCSGTDFLNSKFQNTDLSYADFTRAKNYDIDPNYNKIKKAVFSIPEVLTLLQGFDIVVK